MARFLSLQVFKKRPVLTASIVVVGGLVVYFLFFRGSSGGGGSSEGYTDAQVNAASGLNAAQMRSNARAQEIQGQIAMAQVQGQNQVAVASVQANLQRDVAALSLESARLDNARDLYGLQIQERIETLGMQTSAQIESLRISSELTALQVAANRDIEQQRIMTEGSVSLAQQAANVSIAGLQSQEHIAAMMYGAQKSAAKAGASASKTSSWLNFAGSVVKSVWG